MRNIFEKPRAPFLGRSPVPGPQTPPGQSFGRFYYNRTPRSNALPIQGTNFSGQSPMPAAYQYGAGISGGTGGGTGYETWGTPNNVQNNQGQTNIGYTPYTPTNIFNTGGSATPTPMPIGPELGQSIPAPITKGELSPPGASGGMEQMPTIGGEITGPAPGGGLPVAPPPISGGRKGGGGMYSGPQWEGLDMSGFNPRGQQTMDMSPYILNGQTYHGSSSWASELQDYLNSTGQGDAFSFAGGAGGPVGGPVLPPGTYKRTQQTQEERIKSNAGRRKDGPDPPEEYDEYGNPKGWVDSWLAFYENPPPKLVQNGPRQTTSSPSLTQRKF